MTKRCFSCNREMSRFAERHPNGDQGWICICGSREIDFQNQGLQHGTAPDNKLDLSAFQPVIPLNIGNTDDHLNDAMKYRGCTVEEILEALRAGMDAYRAEHGRDGTVEEILGDQPPPFSARHIQAMEDDAYLQSKVGTGNGTRMTGDEIRVMVEDIVIDALRHNINWDLV